MMKTKKLIQEALSLPVEERALMVDSLLKSLHMPDTTIDAKWTEVARRRLQELRSGKVNPIPGDQVFSEILGVKLSQVSKNGGYDLMEEISPPPFLA
jgi:putative addiction module component (TIGR02574 family)